MKQLSLSGSPRENVGKKGTSLVRKEGRVPAVLYGGKEQMVFSLEENDAKKLVFTPEVYKVELDVAGKKTKAVVKDVQIHPVSDDILHMDFMEILDGKPVKVKLPVRISGSSVGILAGGKLSQLCPDDEWVYTTPLCALRVYVLRDYLDNEFSILKTPGMLPFPYDLERIIDDFVFLCFFVGNDFIPHLPVLDIRDGALDFLIVLYTELLPSLGDYITRYSFYLLVLIL